jgi:hypothetical protein
VKLEVGLVYVFGLNQCKTRRLIAICFRALERACMAPAVGWSVRSAERHQHAVLWLYAGKIIKPVGISRYARDFRKQNLGRRDLSLRSRFQKAELRPQGSLAALEISEN